MLQALWSASSGMMGQQEALDTVANNIANVNTNGYKKSKVEFQDLLYSEMRSPGKNTLRNETVPTGYQIGNGVRIASTAVMFNQGTLRETGNPLDYAIEGNAFFTIGMPDGTVGYTRDGSFKLDAEGTLVTGEGYPVLDENMQSIIFDNPQSVNISAEGEIFELQEVSKIDRYYFDNEDKLEKIEDGYFRPTKESGKADSIANNDDSDKGAYLQVLMPDGKVAYTKDTQVTLDDTGRLMTTEGHPIVPELYLDNSAGSVELADDGTVTAAQQVGKLNMASFTNPAGLNKSGSNLYTVTGNSGAAAVANQGEYKLVGSSLESSNVDVAEEMVNMMMAQRAYQLNSRSIQNSDQMLGMANQLLKR